MGYTGKFAEYKWSYKIRNFSVLNKLARLHIFPQYKVFSLSFWYFSFLVRMGGFREAWTTSDSNDFQLVQSQFVTYRKKHEKKDFVNEEFLHKKINNKDVYIWIMVCYGRYSRRYTVHVIKAVRQCGDLTTLNWSRWLNHCSLFAVKTAG